MQHFGYQFEQRGLVAVKGKGQLMTYYLLGKAGKITPPTAPVSPILGVLAMDTVTEEEESHGSQKSDDKTVIECTNIASYKNDDDVFNNDIGSAASKQPLISDNVSETGGTENTLLLTQEDA